MKMKVLTSCRVLLHFPFQEILGTLHFHLPRKYESTRHHLRADQGSAGGPGAQKDLRPEPSSPGVHPSRPQAPAWPPPFLAGPSCSPPSASSAHTACLQQAGSSAAAAAAVTPQSKR